MKACGLVVEYNPLHNGHLHHIQEAKRVSKSDCIIAVMSSSFLQRGEPVIIDKFHRTKAALKAGVDIVLELPYAFSVQNSDLFALGAIRSLEAIGVNSICFGSESGSIHQFISSYHKLAENEMNYSYYLNKSLQLGLSFPMASKNAFQELGLTEQLDLGRPNNILGFSYVKTILANRIPIEPLTIKRIESDYHDQQIKGNIASATSIRKQLLKDGKISKEILQSIPQITQESLITYKVLSTLWHEWEDYFHLLKYRVSTMTSSELSKIHDVSEGLEHRIIATEKRATSFYHWMSLLKTKRYTWTRLQRIFTHILTNSGKEEMKLVHEETLPYIRMLGFNDSGRKYLNARKKDIKLPIETKLRRNQPLLLNMEERAINAYYSILPGKIKENLLKQERRLPIYEKE